MDPLPLSFFQTQDPEQIARSLLGKCLLTKVDGTLTGGLISETECYAGVEDRASHAYGGRRTRRTDVMYRKGGIAYIYSCYGMHRLLNVVTGPEEVPHAVLIRALLPTHGIETMRARRGGRTPLAAGPAMVAQALGLTLEHNGHSFSSDLLQIFDAQVEPEEIKVGPRVGIDYAGPDKDLPYRFIASDLERILLSEKGGFSKQSRL